MQKIEATGPESQSANITAENIIWLKALYPELLTESVINSQIITATIAAGKSSQTKKWAVPENMPATCLFGPNSYLSGNQ